jgi:glycosyltransferase involved in cell wall biosynthesis
LSALGELVDLDGASDPRVGTCDAIVNFSGSAGWEIAPHPDCPIVIAIHGGAVLNQDFLAAHLRHLETTDVLVVNCESDRRIFDAMCERAGRPRLCVLPLPVESGVFYPRHDRPACKVALGLEAGAPVVGFVGRLLPQKGVHYALRMLARLRRRRQTRNAVAIVVGNYWIDYKVLDYVTAEYPDMVSGLVRALGLASAARHIAEPLNDEDLSLCYGAMDVLIHPTHSIDENFGYVPVEAMACGVPVVGTAYGGLKDTVVDGTTGVLMSTWLTRGGIRMDSLRGAAALEELLTNHDQRDAMGACGVERVARQYSPARCAESLQTAVAEAIRNRRTHRGRPVDGRRLSIPSTTTLLPRISVPLEHFAGPIRHYVSQDSPAPTPDSIVTVPWSGSISRGQYVSRDPAWPVTAQLGREASALMRACARPRRVRALGVDPATLRRIEACIERGLLTVSQPAS